MKKSRMLAIVLSLAIALICVNAYAGDPAKEISALQQKAETMQNQIAQAQSQCDMRLESELKPLKASIESLITQRVQLGAAISQMESQVEDLKKNARSNCRTQVKPVEQELAGVKSQISNLMAKQAAEAAQKANAPQPGSAATAPPALAAQPAPAAPAVATPPPVPAPAAPGKSK
jgi:DNA repair exonuclease SbcCD ATPase subunit